MFGFVRICCLDQMVQLGQFSPLGEQCVAIPKELNQLRFTAIVTLNRD